MFSFFIKGGFFMWPIVIMALCIVYLSLKNFILIYIKKEPAEDYLLRSINSILFWGIMCALVGFLAHYWGLYIALNNIKQAGDVSPEILAGGYQVSLITILSGMVILIFSSIIWFVFKCKFNNMNK